MTIDLRAIRENWQAANDASGAATAAAVVKADGYGLGAVEVSRTLHEAGCRTFFVALPEEGVAVRSLLPDVEIYVLNGPSRPTTLALSAHELRPVLNSRLQVEMWAEACAQRSRAMPAALMLNTGMNRLGLDPDDLLALTNRSGPLGKIDLTLVMSHLACAEDPTSSMNGAQQATFDEMRRVLPDAPASLANSAGIFLGEDYHYELTRPGICLYGASPFADAPAPMAPVVQAEAEVLQIREITAGETVGYGATFTAQRPMRIATIAAGYADGLFRAAGNRANAAVNGTPVRYLGRVSMDLIVVDVTEIGGDIAPGDQVELVGSTISVDDLAQAAGTIGYEVLTSLGRRYRRRYIS